MFFLKAVLNAHEGSIHPSLMLHIVMMVSLDAPKIVRSERQLPILILMLWFLVLLPAIAADGPDGQPVKLVLIVASEFAAVP